VSQRSVVIIGIALGIAVPILGAGSGAASAETAWVRGEVRTNFRAAPLATAPALGVVKIGEVVTVLERKGGWSRIQLAGGASGWLPDTLLDTQAAPTQHLAQLEGELASLREQLAAATHERAELREQNAQVRASQSEREAAGRQLTEENRDLRAGERWPYLITGAAILGAGILVGALVNRASGRRSSSRIRF
jgi:uncharacterized protein YgiM (DUF1202 family)